MKSIKFGILKSMSLENFKEDLVESGLIMSGFYIYGASTLAVFETVRANGEPKGDVGGQGVRFLRHHRIPRLVEVLGYMASSVVGGALMIFARRF